MGNSVSCFDPVREHPPYSWPKDHPERAAKIEELKRQRRNRKVVGTQGNARTVLKESAKEVPSPVSVEQPVDANPPAEEPPVQVDVNDDDIKEDVADNVDEEPETKVEDATEELEEETNNVIEDGTAVLAAVNVPSIDDEETEKDIEAVEKQVDNAEAVDNDLDLADMDAVVVDEEKSVDDELVTEQVVEQVSDDTAPEEEQGDDVADDDASTGSPVKEAGLAVDPAMLSMDTRRAMFDRTEDELPVAQDLNRDVLDPVSKEYISLEEYRRRQLERAQGMVKVRVEKFEGIDDEISRQKAELMAIETARARARDETDWSFKHQPDPKEEALKKMAEEQKQEVPQVYEDVVEDVVEDKVVEAL